MAMNGTIDSEFRSGYHLRIVWNVNSQDINNNSSNVTATVQLVSTGGYINSTASKNISLTIDGSTWSGTVAGASLSQGQTRNLFSITTNVAHNPDGSKVCGMSASFGIKVTLSGQYYDTVSCDGSGSFDTIPRASQPALNFSTIDYGRAVIISTNRVSTNFTHTLRYDWNSNTGTIATNVTDSFTWTVPAAFMNYIPNSTSSYGRIICDTYNGGILIGTKEVRLDTTVPASVVPSFTAITHSDANNSVASAIGKYVQGMSKLNLAITGAAGAYSSTISNYQIVFENQNYSNSSITTDIIKGCGTLTISATITDSRGRTASRSITIDVLPYAMPLITSFALSRCNSDGTANSLGTYVKVVSAGSVSSLVNTTEKNSLTYKILSKARNATIWNTNKTSTLVNVNLSVTDILGAFEAINSFDFRLEITDKFNTTISLNVLPTGKVAMSWAKDGIGIGKVWEQGALDVAGDIYISGKANSAGINSNGNVTVTGSVNSTSDMYANGSKVLTQGNFNVDLSTVPSGTNNTATTSGVTDLNTIWKSGFYDGTPANNNPNGASTYAWILNMAHSSDNANYRYGTQIVGENSTTGKLWYRNRDNTGAGTWRRIEHDGNFAGSASGAGYKWIDGIMLCWGYYAPGAGSIAAANWGTFNFHNAFPSGCFVVMGSVNYDGSSGHNMTARPLSASQFQIYQPAYVSSTSGRITEFWYLAVGY